MSSEIKTDSPVFIIGGSRTGSEMLKTMLSASPELDFVDELFLFNPRWLHKDLASNIREYVGDLDGPGAMDKLIALLYSGIPYGWFWSNTARELDRDMLTHELSKSQLSMRNIFTAIMVVHAKMRGKSGIGAKFPLHYSHVGKLLTWFPNCRLIHTTRNPKAVYASQAAKYLREGQTIVSRSYSRAQQFVHINIQTAWTARLHKRLCARQNYRLVRYEETVLNPEKQLEGICEFLNIDYRDEMLLPKQYGSSFDTISGDKGVSTSSLERWRSDTSPLTRAFMDILHIRANRLLGYGHENGRFSVLNDQRKHF
jgi:hypothetical protein